MSEETVLGFLERRRSVSALALTAPAPDEASLARLIAIATRVPDHGKLAPWRFLVIEDEIKDRLVHALGAIAQVRGDARQAQAALKKLARPPLAVAVISSVKQSPIPEWEQQLSSGAVCTNLLTAALAMGFGANWITGWYAYDPEARQLMGLALHERIAGFVLIGTTSNAPAERSRPDPAELTRRLSFNTPDPGQRGEAAGDP